MYVCTDCGCTVTVTGEQMKCDICGKRLVRMFSINRLSALQCAVRCIREFVNSNGRVRTLQEVGWAFDAINKSPVFILHLAFGCDEADAQIEAAKLRRMTDVVMSMLKP